MSYRNVSGDMYEYDIMDQKIIEYLNEILKNVNMSQEKIERFLESLMDPKNCEQIVLLLRQEPEIDKKLAENLNNYIMYSRKILRVEERTGKEYPRARALYQGWVIKLLNQAGLTNEQKLLMSFASRLQKIIKKKDSNLKETETAYIEG